MSNDVAAAAESPAQPSHTVLASSPLRFWPALLTALREALPARALRAEWHRGDMLHELTDAVCMLSAFGLSALFRDLWKKKKEKKENEQHHTQFGCGVLFSRSAFVHRKPFARSTHNM